MLESPIRIDISSFGKRFTSTSSFSDPELQRSSKVAMAFSQSAQNQTTEFELIPKKRQLK